MEPDAQNAIYFSTKRDNCATTPKSEHHSPTENGKAALRSHVLHPLAEK